MKNNYFPKQKKFEKNSIILYFCKSLYCLAAVFSCQLLHSVFCNMSCNLWKIPLYTHERTREKIIIMKLQNYYENSFNLADLLKGSVRPLGVSRVCFEKCWSSGKDECPALCLEFDNLNTYFISYTKCQVNDVEWMHDQVWTFSRVLIENNLLSSLR